MSSYFLGKNLVCKTISSGCPWRIPKQHAGVLLRETRDAQWESLTPAWLDWGTEILSIWQCRDSHSGCFHNLVCGPQMLRKHRHWSLPYLPRHRDCYLYLINLFDWSEVTSWSQSFIEPWSSIFVYVDQSFCDILDIFKQKKQNAKSAYRIHWYGYAGWKQQGEFLGLLTFCPSQNEDWEVTLHTLTYVNPSKRLSPYLLE